MCMCGGHRYVVVQFALEANEGRPIALRRGALAHGRLDQGAKSIQCQWLDKALVESVADGA